jgi:HD-GYP domain-containing protein (c-di-GMP phosphodiesterase class II)
MNTIPPVNQTVQAKKDFSDGDGLQFLYWLHMLISSAKVYGDNNHVLVSAVENFVITIEKLFREDDEITLFASSGRFYLQLEKVPHSSKFAALINTMLVFFEKRGIKGLRFFPSVVDAPLKDVASFARLLGRCLHEENSADWLEAQVSTAEYAWVDPIPLSDTELEEAVAIGEEHRQKDLDREPELADKDQEKRRKALQAYGYALNSLQEVSQKVSNDKNASIKKALRMVHIMIDTVMDDSNVLLSLSTIRDYDDYTFTHSLNVAILSMCLGSRIGLNKNQLESLSLSALFHDLGKIDVPKKILNKPGKLSEHEFKEMRNHSIYSVRQIILLKASQQRKAEMMLPPFEHHLKYDLSGYPQTPRKKPLSLFGRIICIADVFDAITARRVYRTFPLSPDRALGIMQEGSGKDFDPLLLKVFINMIGVYPIGTLLRLDNNEMGLVAKYGGESGDGKELWVQLLTPLEQGGFAKGELVNLGLLDQHTLDFNRPVLESLHPALFNIQPADYIL